ncbi:cupin domain-containing protein [Brevibacillus dissolubilis]|uniref:cupin domain-containing protein n=1 Tax=Brevibacillus dissolubilis TaxID=1844116 RepID=UPI0011179AC9|nr:cupin domain-containing protein [Brevibacillus dissolubilis]
MFVLGHEAEVTPAEPGVTRKLMAHQGGLMMTEVTFEKDAVGNLHSHPHEQISYIAKGSFEFQLDGTITVIKQGDSVYIPSNAVHGVVALEDSIIVDIFTPQREDFKY